MQTPFLALVLTVSSSLDELDDDLLLELDQVVRENQLAYLPFTRSGRAEALLFEKHPELAEKIERGKRAKVDAIVLSNKFSDGDGLASTSFRAQSLEEISASPLRQRTRRRASREGKLDSESPAPTPALNPKGSVADLMFEMSDGENENVELDIRQPRFAPLEENKPVATPVGSPEEIWNGASKSAASAAPISALPPLGSPSPTTPKSITERTPGRPWGAALLAGAKLDLKDIMAQTSGDKPSNLTLGFSEQEKERKASGSFHAKMSQKERKRVQQAHQLGQPVEKPQPAPPAVSPWQAMSHRKSSNSLTSTPIPQSSLTPSTPQLTMRQTVANRGSSSKRKDKAQASQSTPGSTKETQNAPNPASERGMSVSTTPIPTPHSVRHIPLPSHSPTSPSQHLSMTEILSIQQAEKDYVREAAAKRSLQEIQQEQEFQQWWDQESKRVMHEEEQRKRAEERAAKANRGKGKNRGGRSKGKGKEKKGDDIDADKASGDVSKLPMAPETSVPTAPPKQEGDNRSKSRGRGSRSGRGSRHQGPARAASNPIATTTAAAAASIKHNGAVL